MTEGMEVSLPARPVRKPNHHKPQKRGDFTNGSLGVCGELAARARCLTLSSVIYPQAVDNYGSLGVCGLLPGELAQRAPGKLDHAIGHLPWSTLFAGVWEFRSRQKRLWCVRLGRKPRYILVLPLLQTSHARHFVVVILVPIRYLSYYVSTLLIPT